MRDLVEQAMRGDREAFAWLVNQTSDRMYVADSWKRPCPGAAVPTAAFFAQAGDRQNAYGIGISAGERERLILLDLGGGDVLGILIDSSDPARFDELATAAMPIIESFRFR